ncbi:MAG: S-ribosylhomocysteine lyase [Duodenibacillus sp.]|nr:S-ribosylhomocysteine lyase [Duodenibacillus sp.]
MQRIQSFQIDHDLLDPGIYVSRVDGDITTYDLRTRKPNAGDYMDNVTMHSVEHMIATFIRNSSIADQVIYFGPMGCQTGFYLLIRNADNDVVLATLKTMLQQVIDHEDLVFGASQKECGNYRNLDIECAKRECRRYLDCLNAKPTHDFTYAQ